MKLETTPWDSAEFLYSRDSVVACLEATFDDGEPELIKQALGVGARAKGMTEIVKETGLCREGLYQALKPDGDPKLSTLLGELKALGMKVSARAA